MLHLISLTNLPKLNTTFIFVVFVDVLATAAAFVGMTVHQVLLRRTVSSHRCMEVGRTRRLGSSTCLVLSWCVSLSWHLADSRFKEVSNGCRIVNKNNEYKGCIY